MNQTSSALSTHPNALGAFPSGLTLPFEPLELLAGRSKRLADLVESVSRRRDVRDLRARLLVLLLDLRCPPKGRPIRPWYVPGAVARLGVEGLRRAWRGFYGMEAPCHRTIRTHLGFLELVGAIVRQPGEWIVLEGEGPAGWRPRHADTLHVLDDEASLDAWQRGGAENLRRHPAARTNPDLWRRRVGDWRRAARAAVQLDLFDGGNQVSVSKDGQDDTGKAENPLGAPQGYKDQVGKLCHVGEALVRRLQELDLDRSCDSLDLMRAAYDAGAQVTGQPCFHLAADRAKLFDCLALLARALVRGDAIRKRAAWLVRAHRHATTAELVEARRWALGYGSPARQPKQIP